MCCRKRRNVHHRKRGMQIIPCCFQGHIFEVVGRSTEDFKLCHSTAKHLFLQPWWYSSLRCSTYPEILPQLSVAKDDVFDVFFRNINKIHVITREKKNPTLLLLNARWLLMKEVHAKCFGKFLVLPSQKRKMSKNVHLLTILVLFPGRVKVLFSNYITFWMPNFYVWNQ